MNEILSAIWVQDFDTLLEINSLHILLLLLAMVLFLESSFVFLPLPGDGLVLFVGGLVGLGAVDFYTALTILSLSACLGTIVGYLQGRWLEGSRWMDKVEVVLPDESLPRARHLLNKFGFLSLFVSRFVPFVRVLTPMLMGIARLSFIRTVMISMTSSIVWALTLLYAGKSIMRHPFLNQYQELITRWFLFTSLSLMAIAFITLFIRLIRKRNHIAM
ncbi:DedA family protein [Vibrio crassostreae]|uniref:DedA family protein n=1 Tax=Vibrio crassostreae TaxID=246167 RepID=UPI0006350433|nr:DedA family protein [Vibrio crassostreae]TCT43956.1 membrane protein DedA with SNARE-associated domain [Vibrio crassostreae]TCT56434.1 membrane protein DedA with SNARE-associated domain [Vibrio crassostreae]TCT66371.1 membrane protein DedA with SNARE-associated domain [Vibrio crassostreae]TCT81123.1 membrane protein DedA with SNARE-associated domain [Vibrio crassostreae]TCT99742.1 membrane protein DedA with SNARE-associated domain [Vibrio crassostreae]